MVFDSCILKHCLCRAPRAESSRTSSLRVQEPGGTELRCVQLPRGQSSDCVISATMSTVNWYRGAVSSVSHWAHLCRQAVSQVPIQPLPLSWQYPLRALCPLRRCWPIWGKTRMPKPVGELQTSELLYFGRYGTAACHANS